MAKNAKKTVSLVLGSGGARGLAHVGVINWLNENNYEIKSIAGCSIGALIGGVYAANKLDIFTQWIKPITKKDITALLDLSWNNSGIIKGDKVINTLKALIGDIQIDDLPLPYTAVAVDIINEKEVWLNEGSLFDAIRASISLPIFLTPFKHKGIDLVDGGILNPVPIAPAFNDKNDLIIAVNLGAPLEKLSADTPIKETENSLTSIFQQRITGFIDKIKLNEPKDNTAENMHLFDVADRSFDTMQSAIARAKLAAYPPDFTIDIARNACGTFDFDQAQQMIDMGYNKAEEVLSKA